MDIKTYSRKNGHTRNVQERMDMLDIFKKKWTCHQLDMFKKKLMVQTWEFPLTMMVNFCVKTVPNTSAVRMRLSSELWICGSSPIQNFCTPCSCQVKPSLLVAYHISHKSQSVEGIVSVHRFGPCGGVGVWRYVYQT